MTTTPHADALDFILDWYDATKRRVNGSLTFAEMMNEAEQVAKFLGRDNAGVVVLRVGAATRQDGHPVTAPLGRKGTAMQIRDNEQFTATLEAKDAKGYDVSGDAFTATSADETVVTVTGPDASGTFTIVAGAPGSTVVTFTDNSGITATEAVDVVTGDVATVSVTEGPVSPQS